MNQILGNVCRASIAVAGVMVAASTASAETKPLEFETEFDLGHFTGAGVTLDARPAASVAVINVASAASEWQDSIGAYLDGLLDAAAAPAATVELQPDAAADTAAVVEAEIDAFQAAADSADPAADVFVAVPAAVETKAEAKAEVKAEAPFNPLLLAPVLSHPMDCQQCDAPAGHDHPTPAEQAAAPAELRVDDAAAWQKLADWASARAADDTGTRQSTEEAVTAESDFFSEFDADEEAPTN